MENLENINNNLQEEKHSMHSIPKNKLNYDLGIETIREITKPEPLYLRLYILNGINMTPPDGGSKLNDPYLKIRIGDLKMLYTKNVSNSMNDLL